MISAAAGLAAGGYIPFASTFAKFLGRGYDQIEMAAITRANIKIVGSHAGVSLGADGPSQMGLPDLAFFRSYHAHGRWLRPAGVRVLPAGRRGGGLSAARELMANIDGMCYMRTHPAGRGAALQAGRDVRGRRLQACWSKATP